MIEPTSFATAAPPPVPREKMLGLRVVLIVIAAIEMVEALSDVPVLFGGASILFGGPLELPEPGLGRAIAKLHFVGHPLLALAALALAATGRIRHAIFALGAVVVTTWLNFMPSVLLHGLKLNGVSDIQWTAAQIFVFPLMTVCAITLAARNRSLGLATALVSIPTLYDVFGLVVFAVVGIINGF